MTNFHNGDFGAYKVRRLQKDERVKSFNCGDADLNDFILNQSDLYRKALLAVTYIFEFSWKWNRFHITRFHQIVFPCR